LSYTRRTISGNEKAAHSDCGCGRRRHSDCCAIRSTAPGHDWARHLGHAVSPPRRVWQCHTPPTVGRSRNSAATT